MATSPKRSEDTGRLPRRVGVDFADLSTSAQLREVALYLFAENGIQATSIRMVASAAGVSTGAVLHHFPSKKALESAVREDVLRRVLDAVHVVNPADPPAEAVVDRFKAYAALLASQPYLADYIRRVYAEGGEESIEFFRMMLEAVRAELSARIAAGAAREFDDPDVGLALYCHLVSAHVLIRPQLEAVVGLNLADPNDVERLNKAQTDLLTKPLFSSPPEPAPKRKPRQR